MAKLGKCELPSGHSFDDFKCFGPPATKDTEFGNTKLCDMGCFAQDEVDSNKYYFCCVTQSKKNNSFYLYVEYGRVGASKPQFQFTECGSEPEAQRAYEAQCAEKNTKRGQWETVSGIKVYRPKPGKDVYLVRTMATRSVQLTDAKTITVNEGTVAPKPKAKSTKSKHDAATVKLMRDLLGGAVTYTRSAIQGGSIPVQSALDEGRQLLQEATKRLAKVGDNVDDQVADRDLRSLTAVLYSRIPKIKPLHCPDADWILSKNNIQSWQFDIDAFESALKAGTVDEIEGDDPMHGMPLEMSWIDPSSELGKWLYVWWPTSTKGNHAGVNKLKIKNAWRVNRHGDENKISSFADVIGKVQAKEKPLFQPNHRYDLNNDTIQKYRDAHVALMHHGSRSVNIAGILREGFRFPKELTNVIITGALLGGGTYFAEDIGKSLGYTSYSGSYWSGGDGKVKGRDAFMLVCDVLLGNPHVAEKAYGYTSAPKGTHSVLGKSEYTQTGSWGKLKNNEWVIYDKRQYNIRYLIEFC